MEYLTTTGVQTLPHPTIQYSPDLALCNFFLISHGKKCFVGENIALQTRSSKNFGGYFTTSRKIRFLNILTASSPKCINGLGLEVDFSKAINKSSFIFKYPTNSIKAKLCLDDDYSVE